MHNKERLEDLELRIAMAYEEGLYHEAAKLEQQLTILRGKQNLYDRNEPYSIEGRVFFDDE
ncbi:hypothetical protein A3K86_19460 [Photobacterium jeanii]|uniref:Uncharacterized protein n=1 Tax=Photobacterium jeanii TaxID=858640 RepID=A0A178K2G8_9GAMM|nr:hypothetical protein [Photobacterium jeanii]OAN11145.1 hypothetical protein A3K86_19460 [Photobacterium jeanii]PST90664.1 hypothetical protein C9I91_08560 [Photobacterium jeanii]